MYSPSGASLGYPPSNQNAVRDVHMKPALKNMNPTEERFLRLSNTSVRSIKDVYAHRVEQAKQSPYLPPAQPQVEAQVIYPNQANQLRHVSSNKEL